MGLFASRRPPIDGRPRELRLVAVPVIAADDMAVLVDLVLRFDPKPTDTHPAMPEAVHDAEWRDTDDVVVRAVVLTTMRLRAREQTSEEMLVDRSGLANAVEEALRVAPAPSWYDVRTVSVDVSRYSEKASDISIRVVEGAS